MLENKLNMVVPYSFNIFTTSEMHDSGGDKILKLECSVFFSPNIIDSHLNQ